jgi:hypothetical protein
VGIRVDHHPRLNITLRPIVNQYREGKVKRTPVRGVKEYLNPSIYKQWDHHVGVPQGASTVEPRAFCIMSRLVNFSGEAKRSAEP